MSRAWMKWAAGLTVLTLGVAGAVLVPYRPVEVDGSVPPKPPFNLPNRKPGLRLHVFNTAMNRMSSLLVGSQRPWRPAPAFAIEHPTQGLVLFDTGISREVAREGESAMPIPLRWLFESRGREERLLTAQLREAGLRPEDVRQVIVSHLHEDHVGELGEFPNARIIAGPGSSSFAAEHGWSERWREVAFDGATPLPPFDASLDLFGDGSVMLLAGGGHTREDLMALVSLPSGPVLLAGDAVVHRDWLESRDVQRIAVKPERAADVRNQVRALLATRPDVVMLAGHDLGGVPMDREDLRVHHPEWLVPEAWPVSP
ncbi:MBL fold metallo-hydrolase [Pyxidicoccus parkwayensis]|uniref:MBL fold metallo-hydrolase n=1 Tax=Pyxidicoccus parkwayensis TaxID=2813578 RepID=A0ABX7NRA9_9BACT|nr:MBL fold metallo-hydrolase [Pyxidicoccus parkwaysis]QSQ19936.1 MBL fold metallo-hydrolase [Pyxidicoccus parkwaysis]